MGEVLINDVVPRLRAAASSVPVVGHEDREEILADMTATAAAMIDSAERAGKKFSAGNIAFYASRAARTGRRSTGTSRVDAMAPAALIRGRVRHEHLDGDPGRDSDAEGACARVCECVPAAPALHDIAWDESASLPTDPSEEAARNLDWAAFIAGRSPRFRMAILVLARGGTMREAGRLCGIGDSAARLLRKRLAAAVLEFFGAEVVERLIGGALPAWVDDLRTNRERHARRRQQPRHEATGA